MTLGVNARGCESMRSGFVCPKMIATLVPAGGGKRGQQFLQTSPCLPVSWLAAQHVLRLGTQQLGRERPLPSSLMAVTSPIGTELSPGQRQPPKHWNPPPPSSASCQGKEQTPGARGCPSASKRGSLDDGKLYYKDDCHLNTKHFPPRALC